MIRTRTHTVALATATAGAIAVIVAGCGSSETTTGNASDHAGHSQSATVSSATVSSATASAGASAPGMSAHNSADVMFNQMMIPHHEQAIEMAELVSSRTDNDQIRSLALQIKNAQQPEIDQMAARLRSWGAGDGVDDDHTGHSMGSGAMGGMMSENEMEAMEKTRGAQFDSLWLEGMIAHHRGAIAMANDELASGINPESRELATEIKNSQQAEITQMTALLGR